MQMETEITVLVKSDYETLQKELKEKGFQIDEEYTLNDVYMLDERIDISNMSYLEILKNCILVRNIIGFEMDCIVYTNGKNKLAVQLVNDKYIFIEMESDENNDESVDEMKKDILSYNLSIDESNFFVKKAELMLKEVLEK